MATDVQVPDQPTKPARSWPEVVDNFMHYVAAGAVIAVIVYCTQHDLIDKSVLGVTLLGAVAAVGIKVSR